MQVEGLGTQVVAHTLEWAQPPANCVTHHLLLLCEGEGVAHELRAITNEHLDQLRAGELEEARVRLRATWHTRVTLGAREISPQIASDAHLLASPEAPARRMLSR